MLTPTHTYVALLVVQALHLFHHRLVKRHISFAEVVSAVVLCFPPFLVQLPSALFVTVHLAVKEIFFCGRKMVLEDLVAKLSDLLLSSGFGNPYGGMDDEERTMQALHDAILDALFNGGVLPEETIERLLGAKHLARKSSRVLGHIGARGTAYWNVRLLDRLFDRLLD